MGGRGLDGDPLVMGGTFVPDKCKLGGQFDLSLARLRISALRDGRGFPRRTMGRMVHKWRRLSQLPSSLPTQCLPRAAWRFRPFMVDDSVADEAGLGPRSLVATEYEGRASRRTAPAPTGEPGGKRFEVMPRILGLLFLHMGSAMASPNREFTARHSDRPVVVAHRGASALAPENTLAAIQLASKLGSAAVEFDVHASADGIPVVIHDVTLARTTDGRGLVRKHTLQQLQSLNAGSWFGPEFHSERVPSLAEALQVAGDEMILIINI